MNNRHYFAIFLLASVFFGCTNPWMVEILEPKNITFDTNGGSYIKNQTVLKSYRIERPSDPSKSGYTFDEWYTDNGTFQNQWDFSVIPTAEMTSYTYKMTLYAKWKGGEPTEMLISDVAITVIQPDTGAVPNTTASGDGHFTIGAVSWSPDDNPFVAGVQYTATVTLTAHQGYAFELALNTATVNGKDAAIVSNTASALTLSYTFPPARTVSGISIKTPPKQTYTHGDTLDLSLLVVTIDYDDGTTDDVAHSSFASRGITANPAHGVSLVHLTHDGQPITITYGTFTRNVTVTVAKAAGEAVAAPAADTIGVNSVTLNAVTTANGQTVEYAISSTTTAPASGWQTSPTFDGLSAGTTYYFFARSASNGNYEAGAASVGTEITTKQNVGITITLDVSELIDKAPTGFDSNIIISRTGAGNSETATVAITGGPYTSISWEIPGVGANAAQKESGNSSPINLDAGNTIYNSPGYHQVTVRVTIDGMEYQTSFRFRIVD